MTHFNKTDKEKLKPEIITTKAGVDIAVCETYSTILMQDVR